MNQIIVSASLWIVPLVVAIVLHEVAHGWAARAFGDPTAARLGRLTLNPIKHVDPVGTVGLPLVLAVTGAPVFGWAKPVPVVANRMRNPRLHMMLVALAGPGINIVQAAVGAVLLGVLIASLGGVNPGGAAGFAAQMLVNYILVNVFLALFNLIPLPPFDGGHVVEGLLPRPLVPGWQAIGRIAFPLLIVLLLVLPMISPNLNIVAKLVAPPAQAVSEFFLRLAANIA